MERTEGIVGEVEIGEAIQVAPLFRGSELRRARKLSSNPGPNNALKFMNIGKGSGESSN
jgi:hypothetical protein